LIPLYFERYGDVGETVLILHGLLGSSVNWRTIARRLGEHRRVYVVDQRNHGRSPHTSSHTYLDLASDAEDFARDHGLGRCAVIGHSMGGKAAMKLALEYPDRVARLVVVDIAPTRSAMSGIEFVVEALLTVNPRSLASRAAVNSELESLVPDSRLRRFLMTNLARNDDGSYRWRANLDVIAKHLDVMSDSISSSRTYSRPTVFLLGEESEHFRESDEAYARRLFPQAEFTRIPRAGHWVHVDAPNEFLARVTSFLSPVHGSA
jgi:esterase